MEKITVRGKRYAITKNAMATKVPDCLVLDIGFLGKFKVGSLYEALEVYTKVRDDLGFGSVGYECGLVSKDNEESPFACISYYGIISRIAIAN